MSNKRKRGMSVVTQEEGWTVGAGVSSSGLEKS